MSNSDSTSSASGGIGFCGALAILFIALKLLGNIGWSWWWVLSPLWIPWAILGVILVLVFLFVLFFGKTSHGKNRHFFG
jgi:fatty acid desaturase